jgi:hypothetical protein
MSLMQEMQFARALGSKRYAEAIALLKTQIEQTELHDRGLPHLYHLMGTCHRGLGGPEHLAFAVKAAKRALELDPHFFNAHCLLAGIFYDTGDHVLATLYARNAVKYAKPPQKLPPVLKHLAYFMLLLLRGRKAAMRFKEAYAKDDHQLWLAWANDYIDWNLKRGDCQNFCV